EVSPMRITGETEKRGTEVHFLPDDEIFQQNADFHYDILAKRLRELSFLNNGVRIRLVDERNNKSDDFAFAGGVKGFVEFINTGKKVLHPNIFHALGDKASEQYPLLAAYPARINYQVVLEEPAIENMLRNEQLDLAVDMSPVNFRRLEKDPDLSAKYDFLTNWTTRYNRWVFNMTNPKLKDQRVRQALAYLVNYNDLVQNIQLGLAQRMIGPINPRKGYYNKSLKPYDYNVEEAKRLLAEAGWTDSNNDGTVDKEIDGKRVELTLDMLTTPASKVAEMVGNSIAQSASVGGVKINIVPLSIKELGDLTRGGKFETAIFASAQHSGWADMFQNYHSGSLASLGGDNRNFFADSTFDQAVVKIRTTPDTSARYAPYMEAQRILHEMLPEVVLYTSDYRYIVAKKYRYLLTPNRPGYQEQMFQQR
ncbi:MAG TPA: ABC transporter substrate-binding protein, partial [Saprospiraceae bacterium]|nr:ABC transporter substrate-binding protein [Saprospiraceae bacterium]